MENRANLRIFGNLRMINDAVSSFSMGHLAYACTWYTPPDTPGRLICHFDPAGLKASG